MFQVKGVELNLGVMVDGVQCMECGVWCMMYGK